QPLPGDEQQRHDDRLPKELITGEISAQRPKKKKSSDGRQVRRKHRRPRIDAQFISPLDRQRRSGKERGAGERKPVVASHAFDPLLLASTYSLSLPVCFSWVEFTPSI